MCPSDGAKLGLYKALTTATDSCGAACRGLVSWVRSLAVHVGEPLRAACFATCSAPGNSECWQYTRRFRRLRVSQVKCLYVWARASRRGPCALRLRRVDAVLFQTADMLTATRVQYSDAELENLGQKMELQ